MVEYVNTEIVQYADNLPTFDECYPFVKSFYTIEVVDGVKLGYRFAKTIYFLPEGGAIATNFPYLIGQPIYAWQILSYGDWVFTTEEQMQIGTCYYILAPDSSSSDIKYWRLTLSDIPADIHSPFFDTTILDISGDNVFWLYNFGEFLMDRIGYLSELLNKEIMGERFITLLFGSGFILYVTWTVTKWIIPF